MRRTPTLVSSVAVRSFSLSHAPAYDGAAITTTFTLQHRLFQATPYRSSSNAASCAFRRRFWPLMNSFFVKASSIGLPGALFSVAALSLFQEVYAKELQPPDLVPNDVVLYQYEACPFCNKVKAFLDYYDVKYKVVEVNPLNKKEIKWSDYKKVPILVVDGEQLVDSSAIIDELGHRILQRKVVESDIEDDEEQKWRKWVDDHLVHVLSPNIYRNTAEALEAFNYITNNGNYSFIEKITVKYAGAAAMYFVSKNLKKKYNINDEREALYEAAETWVNALAGREFLGGSKPNIADLAVFGVLRPIRYLRSGRDMVEHTQIGEWYTRMESVVGESSRVEACRGSNPSSVGS